MTWIIIGSVLLGAAILWWIGRWLYVIVNRTEETAQEDFEKREN